jgi:hypothetical protein
VNSRQAPDVLRGKVGGRLETGTGRASPFTRIQRKKALDEPKHWAG